MKRLLATLLTFAALLPCITAEAVHEEESPLKRINKIKRDGSYIYAEATSPSEKEAMEAAKGLLMIEISEYVASKKKLANAEQVVIKDMRAEQQSISMPRGDMIRVFLFVKKKDVEPAQNVAALTQEEVKAVPLPTSVESKKEDLQIGQNAPASISSETTVEDQSLSDWQRTLISDVCKQQNMLKVKQALNKYKAQYKVKRLGTESQTCPTPATAFYAFFDAQGNMTTLLGPENGGVRMDYVSGNTTTLTEQGQGSTIWFVLSK